MGSPAPGPRSRGHSRSPPARGKSLRGMREPPARNLSSGRSTTIAASAQTVAMDTAATASPATARPRVLRRQRQTEDLNDRAAHVLPRPRLDLDRERRMVSDEIEPGHKHRREHCAEHQDGLATSAAAPVRQRNVAAHANQNTSGTRHQQADARRVERQAGGRERAEATASRRWVVGDEDRGRRHKRGRATRLGREKCVSP